MSEPTKQRRDYPNSLPETRGRRRLYLMRHGDVSYYKPDGTRVDDPDTVTLTDKGRRDATAMAELLAEIPFDGVVHSGMYRTKETAALAVADRGLPVSARPAFREIKGGLNAAERRALTFKDLAYGMQSADEPGARYNQGEYYADFHARVVAELEDLLTATDWTRLLLVAHGGTNRAILSWVTRGGLQGMECFEQDTCCLNIIDADVIDGAIHRRMLRMLNLTPENLTKRDGYLTTMERLLLKRIA